jgi:hypothetical protein
VNDKDVCTTGSYTRHVQEVHSVVGVAHDRLIVTCVERRIPDVYPWNGSGQVAGLLVVHTKRYELAVRESVYE